MHYFEFNSQTFLHENKQLFINACLINQTKKINVIFDKDEYLFYLLTSYLKKGFFLDFVYLQKCLNHVIDENKIDINLYSDCI
jgi:hypothetical protein